MTSVSSLNSRKTTPSIHLGCGLLETCHPAGSLVGGTKERRELGCRRTLVACGKRLYESGDAIGSVYSVMAGTFKTYTVTESGEEQILGFYMRGAILGLDAMAAGTYAAAAVAIEDSQVCVVSAECLEQHCAQDTSVAKRLHAAMAREIDAAQRMMLMLGNKTAEERVATFLLELAATYFALGYSSTDMNMLMTRAEIGRYLGLTLETVSRILSDLQDRRILAVQKKHVRILNVADLKRLTG